MKFVLRASCLVLCTSAFAAVASGDSRAAKLKRLYESDDRNYVFVAAHRCDWLTHPENALSAVEGAIVKGVDILEIDAQRTKDGRFVVSHDGSVDRCTEGTGGIGSKTLAELTRLRLRDRNGGKDNPLTDERLPSLEDVLRAAKGRALVNIDRSQNWPEELAAVVRRLGMEDEVIFKSALDLSGTRRKFASAWDGATVGGGPIEFMPILWCYNPTNRANVALADEWLALTRPPRCYEICFGNDTLAENVFRRLLAHPSHPRIWVNVMWGSLCAGHHDGKGGEGWDWSINHGATILQTDHIESLVRHLESRGRHDLDAALANVELSLDLAGEWTVEGKDLSGRLHLPGTLADAKLGRPFAAEDWAKAGDQRVKGALSRAYQYVGPATYVREVELPPVPAPKNSTYEIFLERVMWSCEVFFDGVSLGTCDSLGTPHVHAIPAALATPGKHEIRLAIDNSNIYGFTRWAHSYGEVMQSIWHGVVGKMCIRRVSRLAKARVFAPDPRERRLELELPVGLPEPTLESPDLGLSLVDEKPSPYRKGAVLRTYALATEPTAWTPETPNLHRLVVTLPGGDRRVFRVGFRTIATRGKEFLLNGRPFFLRGNVECCNFPLTGHPAMDVASWRCIFKAHRADGFNAVRFHSWLPPAAAYEAADEIGIFLMPEANIWHDGWMGAADRLPGAGSSTDGFIRRELAAALEAYGNHPSFFSLAIGNELSMGEPRLGVMNGWMQEAKASDPRHLYTISGGRGYVTADGKDCDDFSACGWIPAPGNGFARGAYNNSGPFPLGTMEDFEAAYSHALIPHVRHELGQWVVYPVRSELDKYTGTLRPYDREEFVRRMDKAGLSGFERRFHDVSCRLQDLAYRESIESYLRTPSCAGYQMLEAQDFSGQGEALVGWRDSFYDLKPGYGDRKPFIASVTGVVALVRFPNRCLRVGDTLKVRLQLRNLTAETVSAGTSFRWSFAGRSGVAKLADALPPNGLGEAGTVEIALDETLAGMRHEFVFADRRWPIWVFADERPLARPEGVVFTDDRDVALETLRTGGRVVFTGPTRHGGRASYRPVFWSAAWFSANKFPLLGSIVDAASPLFKGGFPSEDWADLHWNLLLDGTRIHLVDGLSADFTPIVRGIPDFHNPKSASPLFELAVGRGRLLVCGIALDGNEPERVAFRNALFRYVASDAFTPKTEASEGWLAARLMTEYPAAVKPPPEFAGAPVYIEAAARFDAVGEGTRVDPKLDGAYLAAGSYRVEANGSWCDDGGKYWHGGRIRITFAGTPATAGELRVRFRDPNRCGRTGHGTFEGRPFKVPVHISNDDRSVWVNVPMMREDVLDGSMIFECTCDSGPNLMIDRVVFVPGL